MENWQRTHTCGELRESNVGQTVQLNGWVNTYRDQGGLLFIDLRDRYGVTQVVFETEDSELFETAQQLRAEFCVAVEGEVTARLLGKENPELATGKVEVRAKKLAILNRCPPQLPFEVTEFADTELANEDLRLQYRYLDLRRPSLQRVLTLRHRLCKVIRDQLDDEGFLEVETPLLGKSTPEGARDYLVPSRTFPGNFFALPQSPQLYKQLLMVAGYDKYFQIARCLRDEDLRADRQPEFTQLDMEMSFVDVDDVIGVIERLMQSVFKQCIGVDVELPLPRMGFAEAMQRYGSDKPDLRYGLEIESIGDLAAKVDFKDFADALASGQGVSAINAKGAADPKLAFSRKHLDGFAATFRDFTGGPVFYTKYDGSAFSTGIAKYLTPLLDDLKTRLKLEANDLIFIACGGKSLQKGMGLVRTHLAEEVLNLVDPTQGDFNFCWVVDFPSFFWDEDENRWVANHHPFTSPRDEDLDFLESDPGRVRAKAYDLVINGYEVGGGSIRIHRQDVQSRVFRALGMDEQFAKERFGFLLDALKLGAPPHGGIALGLDRWAMILGGTDNIRDVIAFPKNQRARDLMTGAPTPVDKKQLKELGL